MNATTYEDGGEGLAGYDDDFGEQLPQRPRRRILTPWTALLFAVLLGAAGFYVGVRIEKNRVSSTTAATGSFASRLGAAAGGGSTAGGAAGGFGRGSASSTSGGTSKSGASGSTGGSAGGGGFAGFAGGGGTVGTVASVNGNTIYVTETSGNTVKVKLSSATTISKSQNVSKSKLNPGDSVVITGSAGSSGAISATAVTDSGASASSSSGSGSGTAGGGSAVSSLFGGG